MPDPLLVDSVTLLHFSVCSRLSICEGVHATLPEPRWTDAVRSEIEHGANLGIQACIDILGHAWLGAPIAPDTSDQSGIMTVWIGLGDGRTPPKNHAGEAESIYFADKLGGSFATDDNAAYDFAEKRLGRGRAVDTIDLLRTAVGLGHITAAQALDTANRIRASGRFLRSVHRTILTESYFT